MQGNKSKRRRAFWARGLLVLAAALGFGLSARPAETAPFAYVTNYNSSTVSVIDTAINTVVATISVAGKPYATAVTPDGKHAYVVNQGSGDISVIDSASNTVVATIPVPASGGGLNGVAVAPNGKHAYVTAAAPNYNNVVVIDTGTNTVVATVPVGNFPLGVAITPDGTHAYVTNANSPDVSVIDTATNTVGATILVPGLSRTAVAVTPDGKHAYVASYPNGGGGNVYVIDTATNSVEPAVIAVGNAPYAVAITPDGKHAYVANTNSTNVSVIDTTTNTVIATVGVGGGAAGVAVTPDGKRAYVVNPGSNTVSAIDTATNTLVGTQIAVGNNPLGIAIGPPPQCVPFSAFNAKLAIAFSPAPDQDAFGLLASFTLGSSSDGIDPAAEPVTLQVGNFAATIPPGSFAKSPLGTYTFIGTINGVNMESVIQPTGGKQFALEAAALNANLSGTANPVTVRLSIGDDCGTTPVKALIF